MRLFLFGPSVAYGALRGLGKLALLTSLASPVLADDKVIAILGDSLVAGYGLDQSDGLVAQTQAWLDAEDLGVRLINAGVSGDTTAGGLARLDWTLTPDVEGVIVALGGNDVLRGIDPATSRANLDAILAGIAMKGLPVLLAASPAPGNYGAEYKAEFEAIYPDLAEKYHVVLFRGLIPSLVDGEITQEALSKWFQADGLHPNKEGVAIIVKSFAPAVAEFAAGIAP